MSTEEYKWKAIHVAWILLELEKIRTSWQTNVKVMCEKPNLSIFDNQYFNLDYLLEVDERST